MKYKEMKQYILSLKRPKILVIGDLILDEYITGDVERISPEAPIPIVHVTNREYRLGGVVKQSVKYSKIL